MKLGRWQYNADRLRPNLEPIRAALVLAEPVIMPLSRYPGPSAAALRRIAEIREMVRAETGGGPCSAAVAGAVERYFGWQRRCGAYLTAAGEPIATHVWNVLPMGEILDATADRFGEGEDIRVVLPFEPDVARYCLSPLAILLPDLAGEVGPPEAIILRAADLAATRGPGWWLANTGQFRAFLIRQERYRQAQVSRDHTIED